MPRLSRLPRVLIIDDEPGILEAYALVLDDDFQVATATTGEEGLAVVQREDVDTVLVDLRLPGMDGFEVLRRMQAIDAQIAIVMLTAVNDARLAMDALRHGALDYLVKPVDNEELLTRVRQATAQRRLPASRPLSPSIPGRRYAAVSFVGTSPAMYQLLDTIAQVAPTDATVLISGETGVGKELVARALHQASLRCQRPFVVVNCAAIPASLAESTFLGHERGAFTGATGQRRGTFEQAHQGTLFLDEVSDLPSDAQGVLLRVLQEHALYRLGGERLLSVDVRILASTQYDLRQLVDAGVFRADLFYRLHIVPVPVPPLRARREDILLLAMHFVTKYNTAYRRQVQGITPAARAVLEAYDWPGNVRELEHLMARLVAISPRTLLDEAEIRMALTDL